MVTNEISATEEKIIPTVSCSHCGGACLLRVHVKGGVITMIETDNGEEPQYRACLRGRAYRQRVYAPDRLKFPLKRVGERGEGRFERISWDEALDKVASEIKRVRDTYGPASILMLTSGGDINNVDGYGTGVPISRLLSLAGGHTTHWGVYSHEQASFAELATFGSIYNRNGRADLLNSKLIIMWAWNPVVTIHETGTSWYLMQAKEAGIRIICVDPRYTSSAAALAHKWIPIRPTTDAAMLIAMAYVIIKGKLQNQKFLDTYTVGFDKFKDYVLGVEDNVPKTPAWAEAITGVPAATIEELAREYATTKPAALICGIAPGRTPYGEQYHRASITLSAMTGNIGVHGGEVGARCSPWPADVITPRNALPKADNPVQKGMTFQLHMLPYGGETLSATTDTGGVNTHHVADAILKGKSGGYPVDFKLAYILNTNYLNQEADVNKTARAFKALEFIVVHEQFMTATARFADILLPSATFLERNAIPNSYGGTFYGYANKCIEPVGECKSHLQIAAELAVKLGITNFNDKTEDELLRESLPAISGFPDYETFKKHAIFKVKLPEPSVAFQKEIKDPKNNPFRTPSGKIEIYSQRIAELNHSEIPPIPKYIEAWESRNDPLAQKYPLQLLTTHSLRRAHSQFDNLPWLRELVTQAVMINSADANARGISNGDLVRVFNDRGEMVIPATVSERIMPGLVDIPQGAWYAPDDKGIDRGGCSNVLTRNKPSPGGGFVSSACLVQVEKA